MAEYVIAAGDIAVHEITLTPNVVDTVTFEGNVQVVEIISDGAAPAYYTTNGTAPTVRGAHTRPLIAGVMQVDERNMGRSQDVLKFISEGSPTITVVRS